MFTICYNLSCLLLYVEYVFALCCMVFCHLLSLCIQAPADFGQTLAYAAPEDVRRLGREECCARNADDMGPQRRDDVDMMRMSRGEDGACAGVGEKEAAHPPTPQIWARMGSNLYYLWCTTQKPSFGYLSHMPGFQGLSPHVYKPPSHSRPPIIW